MRSDWKEVNLSDVADLTVGYVGTMATEYRKSGVKFIRSMNVHPFRIDFSDIKYISDEFHTKIAKSSLQANDVVIVRTGQPGACAVVPDGIGKLNCSDLVIIHPDQRKIDPLFLSAYINLSSGVITSHLVGAVQQHFNVGSAKKMVIRMPDLAIQKRISSIIRSINNRIETNNQINDNLLQQALAIYHEMFVDTANDKRQICRAEEYFDISIGKTPPRKEHQWFTTDPSNVTWVSISDMGSCGTYISRSAEYLTQEAVDKFNIRVVPSNTVLLSFKLTVGRVAITYGEMTTNEAIAHFKTDKPLITEYLYCYLKEFNYQTMGSTSSIATAVNSKIIKAMPFIIPTDDEISHFHTIVSPMFKQILYNQLENDSLAALRDSMLPKLISGELDVSGLNL